MLALESMAHSTPVITTAGTATAEIADAPELEISPGSYEKNLTQIIEKLIADPESFSDLGSQALVRAKTNYSGGAYFDTMAKLYRKSEKGFFAV